MKNVYSEVLENEVLKGMLTVDQIEEVKRLEIEAYRKEVK